LDVIYLIRTAGAGEKDESLGSAIVVAATDTPDHATDGSDVAATLAILERNLLLPAWGDNLYRSMSRKYHPSWPRPFCHWQTSLKRTSSIQPHFSLAR